MQKRGLASWGGDAHAGSVTGLQITNNSFWEKGLTKKPERPNKGVS